jgi:hypothetical protein
VLDNPTARILLRRGLGLVLVAVGWVVATGAVVIGAGAAMDMDPPPEPLRPFAVALAVGVVTAYIGHRVLRPFARPWTND